MSNIIYMKSRSDWFVMNMVKQHIKNLKKLPQDAEVNEAVLRNEAALRSFHEDIVKRSTPLAA